MSKGKKKTRKEYSLNVDPRVLELLGPNLYTNIYYVLGELIANAYDADASNVYIIESEDSIRVEDDGHGMSYEDGDIHSYLHIAKVSRVTNEESKTRSGLRHKMGRKGVGKLAALSVSEKVNVITITQPGEKSGFVLERKPDNGKDLMEIPEREIFFEKVQGHGTAIVMRNPQYKLHRSLDAVTRNLFKIFPLVNDNFKIHLVRGKQSSTIKNFDLGSMKELSSLVTLGDEFALLGNEVPDYFPDQRKKLVETLPTHLIPIVMKNIWGEEKEYSLEIQGWIGTYKSTRGRKSTMTDFPDNFISLLANKKLGEFNILPIVGNNKLNEVYVVGQLYVDLFELSELPDMALSNRQGYKSDDIRYEKVTEYVRGDLLPRLLKKRQLYTDLVKREKEEVKLDLQKENEERFRRNVDAFRRTVGEKTVQALLKRGVKDINKKELEAAVRESIADSSPDLGLKAIIDSQKKKILISQTSCDKDFSDIVYRMLLFNNVLSEDILYTNCDDQCCRIPFGKKVYEYLREFFVESYSDQKIYVLFVTSENTKKSWGAMTEVGAAWITQVDHTIFNIHPFRPEKPLDDESTWQTTIREQASQGQLTMDAINADIFCQKIEAVCERLGYFLKTREQNLDFLSTLVEVV